MIYIITAMYAEAHPFITRFQLKKDISHTRFQVFKNKEADLCLVISGTGSVPAAVAVSNTCAEYGTGQEDFLLNVGICAGIWAANMHGTDSARQTGKIFLCNKITEQSTGKTFYPDILYRHQFTESQIITGAKPYIKTNPVTIPDTDFCLYDMEAAAIYQAGAYYFGPHQMNFLKILSDAGTPDKVTSGQVEYLIGRNMENIADYAEHLRGIAGQEHQPKLFQETAAWETLEKLCLDMHCSRTMSESIRQYIHYCLLSGVDYDSVIEEMYQKGQLPCKDKREGKKCFEELKKRLL